MPHEFTLKIDARTLDFATRELSEGLHEWSPVWPIVAGVIRGIVQEQFSSEGGRGAAGQWMALSREYARRKQKKHPGKPILEATGALVDSLIGRTSYTVEEFEAERMRFGTSVPYAVYHQFIAPGGKLPPRPIFDFVRGRDDRAVARALNRRACELARGLGFRLREGRSTHAGLVGQDTLGFEPHRVEVGEPTTPLSNSL